MNNRLAKLGTCILFVAAVGCGGANPTGRCVGSECDTTSECGNGGKEEGEDCDGTDLGSATCAALGFDLGTPTCTSDCNLDTVSCCMHTCALAEMTECVGTSIRRCVEEAGSCRAWEHVVDCASSGGTCDDSGYNAVCSGCTHLCASGGSRCNDTEIESCLVQEDGCRNWEATQDCADDDLPCDDSGETAVCRASCRDECVANDTQCYGTVIQSCTMQTNGCLAWVDGTDCNSTGKYCSENGGTAQCTAICTDQCQEGAMKCSGSRVQSCVEGAGSCTVWQNGTDCASQGKICETNGATSSCVEPGVTTTFRVHFDTGYGHGIAIRGAGSPLSWESGTNASWTEGNVWTLSLDGLAGVVQFKPLVDDSNWCRGSNYQVTAGTTIDIYPWFDARYGRIDKWESFDSTILGNSRDVLIYLPQSYDENPLKHYPILFMHDGQNVFYADTSFLGIEWQIDEALNNLNGSKAVEEVIVVAPYNAGEDRTYEFAPGPGGGADDYLDFLLDELKPEIVAAYRTTGAGERVHMAGSSFGGNVTLYGCWTRPEEFDACGVFSPALWFPDEYILNLVANHNGLKPDLKIYIDSGDTGPSQDGMADTIEMRDLLIDQGLVLGDDLMYVLGEGDEHNETAWARRAPAALEFMLADPQRVP